MPHKRAKASVRKARKTEVDLPVSKGDGGVTSQEAPKGFTRLLKFKEMAIKRQQEKKEAKQKKTEDNSKRVTIQPGEKLKDFVRRVENEYQSDVLSAQKASKPVSNRKKRNQELRKQKKVTKRQKELDMYGGRDFDDLKDNVKFGEVADAPPVFNKIPKARGRGKETLQAKNNQVLSATQKKDTGYESEEDENMKALKASHKRKLQNMSAAARIQLENERDMVIEAYRAKKAKKMTDAGLV
ncbi:uncharacterized protein B0P05DRAFT_522203 [Gilbertella persicaria]|uniref:uncharacterized protein n=1 Tax=Gilbertella persicaria TaxID=101096 RepID=UPI00221FD9DF|nr:uncharacterized protein B0P05DRAFT_522203 [Gilbertella persicaria]KAI8097819.1 hypothetical protein B0P05DRAFT_522203 [Gilbertella persicaria]